MNKKAFTLIELLVVISIIAVLLSILMPALNKAKDKARSVICRSNLKHWGVAFALYAENNNDKFMRGWMDDWVTWGHGKQWMSQLRPYYSNTHNFRLCPKTKVPDENWRAGTTFHAWSARYQGGDSALVLGDYGSYGISDWAYCPLPGTPDSEIWMGGQKDYWGGPYGMKNPDNVPLFFDCIWTDAWPNDDCDPPDWEDYADMTDSWGTQMQRVCIRRHDRRGMNILFMDFSVKRVNLKSLWKLKWKPNFDTNGQWAQPNAPWPDWMRNIPE